VDLKIFGAVLIVLACCVCAASATTFSYIGAFDNLDIQTTGGITTDSFTFDASEYNAGITSVRFSDCNPQRVDFVLYQGDGTPHTGYIQYNRTFPLSGSQILSLDGLSTNWSFTDNLLANAYLTIYAVNDDTNAKGILLHEQFKDVSVYYIEHYVFSPIPDIVDNPITKVHFESEEPITFAVTYGDITTLRENLLQGLGYEYAKPDQSLIVTAYDLLDSFISSIPVVVMLLAMFKVIFLDHFFEVILIFESVVIAYSAATSRDFMSAGTKIVRYNRALFEAILGFLGWLVGIFHKILTAIGSLIPLT